MTDTTYYIRSDSPDDLGTGTEDTTSGANRAFKTFTGAEAAIQGTINSGDRVICEIRAGTYSEKLVVDGSTVNGKWIWRALIGHQHLGVPGDGPVLTANGNSHVLTVSDPNVEFEDVEVRYAGSSGRHTVLLSDADVSVRRCIIGPNTGTSGRNFYANSSGGRVEACLIHDQQAAAESCYTNSNNVWVICCTVVNNAEEGVRRALTGILNVHNTVSYGNVNADFESGGGTLTGNYNASEDGTAVGAQSYTFLSDPFNNYASEDYTITDTGSACYDAGSSSNRPTADSYGNSNRDITNTQYSTNDIGCYAFSGGAPTGPPKGGHSLLGAGG